MLLHIPFSRFYKVCSVKVLQICIDRKDIKTMVQYLFPLLHVIPKSAHLHALKNWPSIPEKLT
jgi:hypothetical protein